MLSGQLRCGAEMKVLVVWGPPPKPLFPPSLPHRNPPHGAEPDPEAVHHPPGRRPLRRPRRLHPRPRLRRQAQVRGRRGAVPAAPSSNKKQPKNHFLDLFSPPFFPFSAPRRRYFRQELERLDEGLRKEDMAVHVRRDHVFEDSYRELHRKSPEEMKNRL